MINTLPNLHLLRRYLEATGWTSDPLDYDGLDSFLREEPGLGSFELLLPAQSDVAGTEQHIEQALRTVSGIENRPILSIAEDVSAIGFDRIDTAISEGVLFRDSIPLRIADTFLRQSHRLMVSTAVAEFEASSVVEPGPAGDKYGDECRFAHTFPSSFGFRVLSPVGPHAEHRLNSVDSPPPPSRRIVQRLCCGLEAIEAGFHLGDTGPIVRSAGGGLNADGCFALARLMEGAETETVKFNFAFSPEWRLPEGSRSRLPLELRTSAVSLIREAAKEMRVRPSGRPQAVRGRVVRLTSEHDPGDLLRKGGREIGVKWSSDDFGRVNVFFFLSVAQYDEAIEAHRRGQDVQVIGVVDNSTRNQFRIHNIQDFRTL